METLAELGNNSGNMQHNTKIDLLASVVFRETQHLYVISTNLGTSDFVCTLILKLERTECV